MSAANQDSQIHREIRDTKFLMRPSPSYPRGRPLAGGHPVPPAVSARLFSGSPALISPVPWLRALAVFAAVALVLPGCATQGGEGSERVSTASDATRSCVLIRTISSWEALDSYRIVINRGSPENSYEISFDRRCGSVRHADKLLFSSRDDEICGYRGDAAIVGEERCRIGVIRRFDEGRFDERAWKGFP